MWTALRRFKELPSGGRRLFLHAAILLPLVGLSLRFRGYRATQNSLKSLLYKSPLPTDKSNGVRAHVVAQAVRSASYRGLGSPTCLEKSLALWWLLKREGIASEIRIGAKKDGERFEAHAWVECKGVILNEPQETHKHYRAFDESFLAPQEQKNSGRP
jgi:hypothetical protein